MTLPRFFILPGNLRGSTIILDDPRDLHHLRDVLRLGVGDSCVCADGGGTDYVGTIAQVGAKGVIIRVEQRRKACVSSLTLWLAPALLKADRLEWVIQKSTELGVARLLPLVTRHTVVRLSSAASGGKLERWRRIATEAAKQCGRADVPVIDPPQSVETLVRQTARSAWLVMPTLAVTAIPLAEVLKSYPAGRTVVVLIGPEGDFSPDEVALAERFGARPVSLGRLTLRAETAAVATLAVVRYALDS